jgi:DNA-binding beta-propeller fold protein YncE
MRATFFCLGVMCILSQACDDDGTSSGDLAVRDMAATDDGSVDLSTPRQYLFVSASGDNTVRVFTMDEQLTPVKTIPVCNTPAEVRGRKDGKVVWTVCRAPVASDPGQAAIIDTETLTVKQTVEVGVRPTHSYAFPDGKRAIVCNDGAPSATVIDTDTGATQTLTTETGHKKVAFAIDGDSGPLRFMYVTSSSTSKMNVFDAQLQPVTTLDVGQSPHGMSYSVRSKRVYNCSGDASNNVEVISTDGATPHTIIARIPLAGGRCSHLEVTADGRYAVGSIGATGKLARIDVDDNSVTYLDGGRGPDWFAFWQGSAWIADTGDWTVYHVLLAGGAGAALRSGPDLTMLDGSTPSTGSRGLAFYNEWIFVANQGLNNVTVVNAEHGHVHATLDNIPGARNAAVGGGGAGNPYPR